MILLYYDKRNKFYICAYTCNFMEKKNYFLNNIIYNVSRRLIKQKLSRII